MTEEARLEVPEEPNSGSPVISTAPAAAEIAEVTAEVTAHQVAHPVEDRARARALFERLAELARADPERLRLRGELVELHLPLVEYLARRFRNRGEWLDDLTQVATIGLIKSIDRFDLAAGWSSPPTRRRRSSARSSGTSATRAGRSGCRGGSRS